MGTMVVFGLRGNRPLGVIAIVGYRLTDGTHKERDAECSDPQSPVGAAQQTCKVPHRDAGDSGGQK